MQVAILSDIHGNLVALNAILSDLQRRKVEIVLYLGDAAATGPQPREVIELLQTKEWPCVMGNADYTLAKNVPPEFVQAPEEDKRRLREMDEWTRKQLNEAHRKYLSTFKPTIMFTAKSGLSFVCYHGSPRSNHEGIFAATSDDQLAKYLEGHEADIFAGGHTHMQMFRRFRKSIIVNPGSVGLPFDMHPAWVGRIRNPALAEYAIVSHDKSLGVELLSIPYTLRDLETAVRSSGLPNPDWWLSDGH